MAWRQWQGNHSGWINDLCTKISITMRDTKKKNFLQHFLTSKISESSLETSTQAIAVSTLFNDLQAMGLPIRYFHCCSLRHLLDSLYRFARPRNFLLHFSDRLQKSFWISLDSLTHAITFSTFFFNDLQTRGFFIGYYYCCCPRHLLEFSSIQVCPASSSLPSLFGLDATGGPSSDFYIP